MIANTHIHYKPFLSCEATLSKV